MNKTKLFFLALLSLLFACKDDELFESFSDPNYPTRYCVLSDSERNELYTNFDSDLKDYFEVDSFGHLDRKNGKKLDSEIFEGKLNSVEDVESIARNHTATYQTYYGISNVMDLNVRKTTGYWVGYGSKFSQEHESDRNRWYVSFENQIFENIEVYGSKIGMYISPKGVYQSFGHWYPQIHLPSNEDVGFSEAKQKIVGKIIGYSDWGGSKQHAVTLDDFYSDDTPEKMIIPFRKGDCVEMRLCWKIESKTIWNFYVDVMSGELIMNEQTVYF